MLALNYPENIDTYVTTFRECHEDARRALDLLVDAIGCGETEEIAKRRFVLELYLHALAAKAGAIL